MALIAGYVSPTPLDSDAIRRRLVSFRIVRDESNDYNHRVLPNGVGHLLVKARPTHPLQPTAISDDAGHALVTLGFLHRAGEMIDPRRLFDSCVATAGQALEDYEGEFLALFAEADGTLHAVNDRFASRPCYWLAHRGAYFVSSNLAFLLALAGQQPPPDPLGWVQVGTLAHTLGTRTTLQGVSRLPPSSHMTLRPTQVALRRYWKLEYTPEDLDVTRHARETFEAFRAGAVMRAKLADRGIVTLSGGLDSRMVAAVVAGTPGYAAFTMVDSPTEESTAETRAAAEVSRVLGMSHRIARGAASYSKDAESVIRLTGGLRPLQHVGVVMFYLEEMERLAVRFMLGGGAGGILAGSPASSAAHVNPAATEACVADSCRRSTARLRRLDPVLREDILHDYAARLSESLAESFSALKGPTAAHRLTAWNQLERQPAFTFTSLMHTHPDVGEAFCYLDYRYVDMMLRLPAAWLYRRSFSRVMLYEALPQLRHVPYANTGELLTGQLLAVRDTRPHPARAAFRRVVTGVKARLLRQRPGLHAALFRTDHALIASMRESLHVNPSLRDILDVEKCDRYLREYEAGRRGGEEPFGMLATLCLAPQALA